MIGPMTRRLMEWIYEEGFCDEATLNKDWIEYGLLLATEQEPRSEWSRSLVSFSVALAGGLGA